MKWFKRYDSQHLTHQKIFNCNDKNNEDYNGKDGDNDSQRQNKSIFSAIVLSFDTAIKAGDKNDPTVCTIWGVRSADDGGESGYSGGCNDRDENGNDGEYGKCGYYLLDIYRDWLEYPQLKKCARNLIDKWRADAILIEDKASGQSLIQDLKQEGHLGVIAIKVKLDKITRFASVSAIIEGGGVFLPQNSSWLADYQHELVTFPNGAHDDQVDSTSQFLEWIKGKPDIKSLSSAPQSKNNRWRMRVI